MVGSEGRCKTSPYIMPYWVVKGISKQTRHISSINEPRLNQYEYIIRELYMFPCFSLLTGPEYKRHLINEHRAARQRSANIYDITSKSLARELHLNDLWN